MSACSSRSACWSPRQDFNLHARGHSFLRRACLAVPSRGGAKRGDRTRHLLLVMQPAYHLPCFAFVHRQGVEPCCADLSGPVTYPRRGAGSAARVSSPSARLIRPGSSPEVGGSLRGTAPRDRTELQCLVRACPAPAGERRGTWAVDSNHDDELQRLASYR